MGKQRLVLDLSCRKRDGRYYVVTDRWQRFSELVVDAGTLSSLGKPLAYFALHFVECSDIVISPLCNAGSVKRSCYQALMHSTFCKQSLHKAQILESCRMRLQQRGVQNSVVRSVDAKGKHFAIVRDKSSCHVVLHHTKF